MPNRKPPPTPIPGPGAPVRTTKLEEATYTLAQVFLVSTLGFLLFLMAAMTIALVIALAEGARQYLDYRTRPAPAVEAVVELPDLDAMGARLIWSEGVVRYWSDLAERHAEASAIACEDLAWHAERHQDTRLWAHGGRRGD